MGKKEFRTAMNICMDLAGIENATLAKETSKSPALINYWRHGGRPILPKYMKSICDCLQKYIEELHPQCQNDILNTLIKEVNIGFVFDNNVQTIAEIDRFLIDSYLYPKNINNGLNSASSESFPVISRNRTCAVVFDFDGTLSNRKELASIWMEIWVKLDYSRDMCSYYHNQFDEGEISHQEWCDITCEYFQKREFHSEMLDELARNITLLKNTEKLFQELKSRNIEIYIISGSIIRVIRTALGELCSFVSDIQANDMVFNEDGYLDNIVGTDYDFEGKAEYISRVLGSKTIAPQDVLFVGNSNNDEYVKLSGATTLCINPAETNYHDRTKWDHVLLKCDDAMDILDYLK